MNQSSKQSLGASGEYEVISRLILQGWDACISNLTKNNFKLIDVFCHNPELSKLVGIQVKTTTKNIFPIGMTIGDIRSGNWHSKILGPWIFVQVKGTITKPDFRFFILSRSEMIKMVEVTHDWYINQWNRTKPLSDRGVVCIYLKWLEKIDEKAKFSVHPQCIIPLKESAENQWSKLWDD